MRTLAREPPQARRAATEAPAAAASGRVADLEREADQLAEAGMRHTSAVALGGAGAAAGPSPPPDGLPRTLRWSAEAVLGEGLGDVRVRTDAGAAEARGARAFARGREVVFARGEYAPETGDGRRLALHELAHLAQQRRGAPSVLHARRTKPVFWGVLLPGLRVPAHANAVSGIHDWSPKYATPGPAGNKNVFYAGDVTLQQICTFDEHGAARVYVYYATDEDGDSYAVGPDALGTFVFQHGGTIAAKVGNTDKLAGSTPIPDVRRMPVARDAVRGEPELYYVVVRLPAADQAGVGFQLDYYSMQPMLRREQDGTLAVLYYLAENPHSDYRPEYVVSPSWLAAFRKHEAMYANVASFAYPLTKGAQPAGYQAKSARFVRGVMKGDVELAEEGLGAWKEAATDPGWWLQVGVGVAGAATPAAPVRSPSLSVVRPVASGGSGVRVPVATGGSVRRVPIASGGSSAGVGWPAGRRVVASGGGTGPVNVAEALTPAPVVTPAVTPVPRPGPVGVPGWNPRPAPVTPRPRPPAPAVAAGTAAGATRLGDAPDPSAGGAAAPAPAPAPAEGEGSERRSVRERVADSNIFMDRVEGGPAQRKRIDDLYLADPGLTLYVPASAIGELRRVDPAGTQVARFIGGPGQATRVPDVDGDLRPYAADLPRMVSARFDENDLRIALRAKERRLPLLTANRRMRQQVTDTHFPQRVAALAGLVVEVP